MKYVFALLGMAASILMIKYRDKVAEMVGEADWMQKVGGVHNVIVLVGIIGFFWFVSELTGTRDLFLSPLKFLIPGSSAPPPPPAF